MAPDMAGQAAAWLQKEFEHTDAQIEKLRKAAGGEGTKGVLVESAILGAESTRQIVAGTITAAESLDLSLRGAALRLDSSAATLAARIDAAAEVLASTDKSTSRLARRTWWLVVATFVLAGATIIAAIVGAVATWKLTSPVSATATTPVGSTPAPPTPAPKD